MKDIPKGTAPSQSPFGPPASDTGSALSPTTQNQVQDLKTDTKQEVDSLKRSASAKAHETADSLKSEAKDAFRQAQDAGTKIVSEQKQALVHKVHQYQEAIRAAAGTLRDEEENILVGPAEKAADQLERVCQYLDHHEPADLLHEVESLAQRRPELVFGALFVAGFAASRFFKASRRRPRTRSIGTVHAGRTTPTRSVPLARDTSLSRPPGQTGFASPGSSPVSPLATGSPVSPQPTTFQTP